MRPPPRTRSRWWTALVAGGLVTLALLTTRYVTLGGTSQLWQPTTGLAAAGTVGVANSCHCPACPSCPAPSFGTVRDVAVAAKKFFGWETPIIDVDLLERHKPAFWLLPSDAFPAADASMVAFWHQIAPFTKEYVYKGNNGMFGRCDSAVLHAIVRHFKPARVVEVGSGYSTHVVHQALATNTKENGTKARHTCVEPYRAAVLNGLDQIEVIEKLVQEVDLTLFDQLQAGDILFLDTSHVIRPYGDVIYELLWILPRLQPGVIVHIHDILLPYDYLPRWITEDLRHFTEQYMLAAFLYGNSKWKVLFHNGHMNNTLGHLLQAMSADEKAEYLQFCSFNHETQPMEAVPGSIYLQRVA